MATSSTNPITKPEEVINSTLPQLADFTEEETIISLLEDHEYMQANEPMMSEFSEQVVIYIAGFVTRKLQNTVKCETCVCALRGDKDNFLFSLITQKNRGGLCYPDL